MSETRLDKGSLHKLLAFGVERGVSDIHFEVGYPPHYRLHGELLGAIKVPPLTSTDTEAIAAMIMEKREPINFDRQFGEIDVSYSLSGHGSLPRIDFSTTRIGGCRTPADPVRRPQL